MKFLDKSVVEYVALGVIDRTLPKAHWTHAAHFAFALWILRHRPELASPDVLRTLISRYNETTGTPNTDSGGYHHTITMASIRAASEHLNAFAQDISLDIVLASLMTSPLGHHGWLLTYWHHKTLFSTAARKRWLEPDIKPLPFS